MDDNESLKKLQERKEMIEGLTQYYKLKSKYQEKIDQEKKGIAGLKNKSWREKRKLYRAIQKKCVHCGGLGGTLFTEGLDEESGERVLRAICGNRQDPCSLDIEIHLGYFLKMDESLLDDEEIIEDYKNQLIREKNDLIFGYIGTEEAIEKFETVKINLSEAIEIYEYELVKHDYNRGENAEKQKEIREKEEEIYQNIKSLRKILEDYERSQNIVFIQDAVQYYNQEINEKIIELRQLKYPVCYVDYDENDGTFHLIQKHYDLENIEENFGKQYGVSKMILTMRQRAQENLETQVAKPIKTKTRTLKRSTVPKERKTRKSRKLVIEEPLPVPVPVPVPVPMIQEESPMSQESYEYYGRERG